MSAAEDILFELLHMEIINTFINDDHKDDAATKLEYVGFTTGYRFVERATRENNRFKDELDIMKYICKVFWVSIFKKEIDNLRTNHQGVYVLNDNTFRFLTRIATGKQYLQDAPKETFNRRLVSHVICLKLKRHLTCETSLLLKDYNM